MAEIPSTLAWHYRLATDQDIRSWSFGVVKAARTGITEDWQKKRGTLDDQAIFGPLRDYHRACGKYAGQTYRGMICDRCGVKLTQVSQRRRRFGHINLPVSVAHPLGNEQARLTVFPVLPAAFFDSTDSGLGDLYDRLVIASLSGAGTRRTSEPEPLPTILGRLVDLLLPLASAAQESRTPEASSLAAGLALAPAGSSAPKRCNYCGYPVEGLQADWCPGCGNRYR